MNMNYNNLTTIYILYVQKPPLNTELSCRVRALTFGLSFHLHPYFVYPSRRGSGESGHWPGLDLHCLQKFSTKDTRRQFERVKGL